MINIKWWMYSAVWGGDGWQCPSFHQEVNVSTTFQITYYLPDWMLQSSDDRKYRIMKHLFYINITYIKGMIFDFIIMRSTTINIVKCWKTTVNNRSKLFIVYLWSHDRYSEFVIMSINFMFTSFLYLEEIGSSLSGRKLYMLGSESNYRKRYSL